MNRRFTSMVVVALFAFALGSQASVEFSAGQETTAKKAAPAKTVKKPRGRLPAYYAQIGLSTEQRNGIYAVQATYGKQIGELQKQIDALKEKEGAEIVAVLKPEQKQKLDELLAAAKKRAEERRSKAKKKTS